MKINKIIETSKESSDRFRVLSLQDRILPAKNYFTCTIRIDQTQTFQRFEGFGGALTESAGYVLSQIPAEKRKEVITAYYSAEKGNGYTLARTHMNSCDFSLENWACVEQADESLESFSMERTDKYITPLIREAQDCMGGNLRLLVSPWSPPAWMKDNGEMNHGGKLFKKYYPLWAAYFIRFIEELKKRGINTWAVSVQNEPLATMTWDSCVWSAAEEGEFAAQHLGPALEKYRSTGGRILLLVLDHNREILWERFSGSMAFPNAEKYIDGAAFHWYSGDQYDNVEQAAKGYPGKELFFTEGCIEGGPRPGAWFPGERYAHNIINDLNSGCTGWVDWNIVLDMRGGPNHVGNFCDAPVLADTDTGELNYQSSYYYIGHFSRYIKPGAQRIALTVEPCMVPAAVDGRMGNMVEFCAFKNIDGSQVIVAMNRTEADMPYEIVSSEGSAVLKCPPRGIQTLILSD
jgi:glucosylceramidase